MTESPLVDSGFVVPVFSPGDDLITCLNKAMAFLTVIASSRGNNASRQAKVVKCYNCQGERHMARQCTQPKRPRDVAWYKEKAMLAEAQEAGQALDEEQLAFLADLGVPDSEAVQKIIPNNTAFQTEDLDTYDSDGDDISNAKVVLMANISNYGSDVILEVVKIVLWYMEFRCSKHMTGNCSQLMNFVSKFSGTVRFGNDHIAGIIGYVDYQLGNVTTSRVYYVAGLGHNLFSVDAPSTSIPSTQDQEQSPIISQGFEESPKTPHFHDDPLLESLHEDVTSQGLSSNVRSIYTLFESLEPKNFKQAMTEPSWIDAMQEEIHEFERLQVWELVPCPDKVF
nr:integrase, catalytic region, zinc finger, CCHC-type, peptidase aspartic, catalytic [Tanacetum cinerariifolium]